MTREDCVKRMEGLPPLYTEAKMPVCIQVLGPGCNKCMQTEKAVREAIAEARSDAVLERVLEYPETAGFCSRTVPAVIVDGQVMAAGRVPTKEEVLTWL